jgi:cytochrome c-type biogenesis protein CcmH/NrfF
MTSTRWVARALWLVPAFLLVICGQQIWAAYTLGQTLQKGTPTVAEVTELHQENRVDVTYDYMKLRVERPEGGGTLRTGKMSVPHTLAPLLQDKKRLKVFVRSGAAQEVVLREKARSGGPPLGATQQRLAVVNAAMSGVAALLFGFGVFWWNRYLRRRGDPASERAGRQRDEDYSAGQTVRE